MDRREMMEECAVKIARTLPRLLSPESLAWLMGSRSPSTDTPSVGADDDSRYAALAFPAGPGPTQDAGSQGREPGDEVRVCSSPGETS